MPETLQLEVVTPERRVVQAEVAELVAPGALGEFGVLSGHEPFVTALDAGLVSFRPSTGGETRHLGVSGGFAEVAEDRVILLVDTCEAAEEIDRPRAEAARDRATQRLKELPPEDAGVGEVRAALARAEARLAAAAKTLQ
jgi:F-type H+-transporting ATPase subunit epsilon